MSADFEVHPIGTERELERLRRDKARLDVLDQLGIGSVHGMTLRQVADEIIDSVDNAGKPL